MQMDLNGTLKPFLIIVRGLPGSGKSTYAKALNAFHVEADMFHMKAGVYNYKSELSNLAHRWCMRTACVAMEMQIDVVISNTFTTVKEFRPYLTEAWACGYNTRIITLKSNHGSIHAVPADVLAAMKARWEPYEGEIII